MMSCIIVNLVKALVMKFNKKNSFLKQMQLLLKNLIKERNSVSPQSMSIPPESDTLCAPESSKVPSGLSLMLINTIIFTK